MPGLDVDRLVLVLLLSLRRLKYNDGACGDVGLFLHCKSLTEIRPISVSTEVLLA